MFDLSFPETFVILTVALVILGPDKLPKFARFVGSTINKIKEFGQRVQTELIEQTQQPQMNDISQSIKASVGDLTYQVKKDFSELKSDISSIEKNWENLTDSGNLTLQPIERPLIKSSLTSKYQRSQRNKYKQRIKTNKMLSSTKHTIT